MRELLLDILSYIEEGNRLYVLASLEGMTSNKRMIEAIKELRKELIFPLQASVEDFF